MSLHRFIKLVNECNNAQFDACTPTVEELLAIAAELAHAKRARGLVACPLHTAGPSLLQYVDLLEQAQLELAKLGIPVKT